MSPRVLPIVLLLSPAIAVATIAVDASTRRRVRDAERPAIEALARRLPTNDLALSGGARWLRAVSLEEPGAAFADGPAAPDPDPAGAAIAPPIPNWVKSETRP